MRYQDGTSAYKLEPIQEQRIPTPPRPTPPPKIRINKAIAISVLSVSILTVSAGLYLTLTTNFMMAQMELEATTNFKSDVFVNCRSNKLVLLL